MRTLRIAGIVIGCIVVVLIAAAIALWLIVNPNDYKGRIEAAVRTSTGRDLSLTGNIRLAIFPSLALELGPASLGNPPGFSSSQPFASLRRVSLRVHVLPLLHHRLDVGRVEIDGLDLRLLKNTQGQGNWAMPAGQTPPPPPQSGAQASQMTLGGIEGVVIKKSHVSYQDMVADDVNVTIGHVATGVAVPIKWNVNVTTSAGTRPIALSGNATLEYDSRSAHLTGLDARIDDSTVRGNAAVTNLTTGALGFDLSIDRMDLDRYLGTAPKSAKTAAPAPGQQPTELPTGALKTLQLTGKLAIGSATVHGMKLSQVEVGLAADGGVLHIKPAAAELYGGTSSGDITVNAHDTVPVLDLNENLSGIQIQPLLTDFAKMNRVTGRGNVTVNVTAHGNTTTALIGSLDGHAAVNLTSGAIQGINLWSAINSAVALAQRQSLPAKSGGNSTPFDAFKASADLTNGVATTKDLDIASGDLHVTGQGTANLATQAVNYRVNAAILKGAATSSALANIPLLITGTMTSPSVRPDTQALVKSVAQQQLQKQKGAVVNKVRNALKGLIH
ncbi:MAG TPA: AsmA family protein [Steroidobacteraceae bacterium]|jgi:AsmA protein|nr:AsmA family protein [Steroidobacteraceae bacterium]